MPTRLSRLRGPFYLERYNNIYKLSALFDGQAVLVLSRVSACILIILAVPFECKNSEVSATTPPLSTMLVDFAGFFY